MLKRNTNNNRHQKFSRPQHRQHNHQGGKSLAAQRNHLQQNFEKYLNLARDASSSGDKILAENYYQYAEHYLRTLNDVKAEEERIQAQQQEQRQHQRPHQEKASTPDTIETSEQSNEQDNGVPQEKQQEAQSQLEEKSLELQSKDALNEEEKSGIEAPLKVVRRPRTRRPKLEKDASSTTE